MKRLSGRRLNIAASAGGLLTSAAILVAAIVGAPQHATRHGAVQFASIAGGAVVVALALSLLYVWRRHGHRSGGHAEQAMSRRAITGGIAYVVAGTGLFLLVAALLFRYLELVASVLGMLAFGTSLVFALLS